MYEILETAAGYQIVARDEHGVLPTGPTFTDPAEADCAVAILNDEESYRGTRESRGAAWLAHCRRHGYPLKRLRSVLPFMPRISAAAADWR